MSDKNSRPAPNHKDKGFWAAMATPERWLKQGERLRRAAEIVWNDFAQRHDVNAGWFDEDDVAGVALFLSGLALECLAKGLVAIERHEQWKERGKITWPGNGHRLMELVRASTIAISDDEFEVLRKLTKYVEWRGRYPVPTSGLDGRSVANMVIDVEIWKPASELYTRLMNQLVCGIEAPRSSGGDKTVR